MSLVLWLAWFGVAPLFFAQPSPGAKAPPPAPRAVPVWLEVAERQTPAQARALADRFQVDRHLGNRTRQILIVDPGTGTEGQDVRVWFGPFSRRVDAFTHGLALLEDPVAPVSAFQLRRFDGVPVTLQVPGPSRGRLRLARTRPPYPQLGVALFPQVAGFAHPDSRLPRFASAVARLSYRDEVWIQAETEVCDRDACRRWFYAVTPAPHRLAWFAAGQVVPVDGIRSQKTPAGQLERYTAVVRTGRSGDQDTGLAMSFLGSRRPLRWVFRKKGFTTGRLQRQEDGSWGVFTGSGIIPLGSGPSWLPVESLFRSAGRRQFF
jgi:hypothetical protein